jgi:hypothetical protein
VEVPDVVRYSPEAVTIVILLLVIVPSLPVLVSENTICDGRPKTCEVWKLGVKAIGTEV